MSESGSLYGLPAWVEVDADVAGSRIFLLNVTPEQGSALGAIVEGRYDNTGYAKRAVIPLSDEMRAKYLALQGSSSDDYAAYGAAMNIGTPALNKMESDGWTIVMPSASVLNQRGISTSAGFDYKLGTTQPAPYEEFQPSSSSPNPSIPSSSGGLKLLLGAAALYYLFWKGK